MEYSDDNILTKSAVLIIYENGDYLLIPKKEGLNNHIHYIDYEIKNGNKRLEELLKECDLNSVIENPYNFINVINTLTENKNIILINYACNYMGTTNYFAADIPEVINDKQKNTIKEFEEYIKELEFDHIGQYNTEYSRVKTTTSVDLIEHIKEMEK